MAPQSSTLRGCLVWPGWEAWFSLWDSPLSWHLRGSGPPQGAPCSGEVQVQAPRRLDVAALKPCSSLYNPLGPENAGTSLPSALRPGRHPVSERLRLTVPISVTPSSAFCPECGGPGHKDTTLPGGLYPLLSPPPLLSLAQACPQPVVGETCKCSGFLVIDFRNYRENLYSHM